MAETVVVLGHHEMVLPAEFKGGSVWICLRRLLLDGLELILNEVVKKHIPTKQRCVKKTKQPAWIDENIMSAIKKCDRELLVKQTALMTGQNTNAGSAM